MSLPSQPSGSDQLRAKPQAVFSQTSYNEIAKQASDAGLLRPSGSGLTPLAIGESIPLVFCKRTGEGTGGVFLSPRAAKLRFTEGSTATVDPNYQDVLALLPLDNSLLDEGPTGLTVINSNCTFSTSIKQFGTHSLFDGIQDTAYLEIPGATMDLSGAWTCEFWFRPTLLDTSRRYVVHRNSSPGFRIEVTTTNWYLYVDGGTDSSAFGSISTNVWYHLAIVSDGATGSKLYVDGSELCTINSWTDGGAGSATGIRFGARQGSTSSGITGYYDDIRISKIARYSGTFTPPTTAYPTTGSAGIPLIRNYWLVPSSGQLDNPSLTFFYGDQILGSGTLYYNTACPFTPVKTVTEQAYIDALPESVGDANGSFAGLSCIDYTYEDSTDTFFQAHVYTNFGVEVERLSIGGTGASNLFTDLMNYLLQETAQVPAELIDTTELASVGTLLENNNLFYDGAIQASTNLRQFLENGSYYFLVYVTQNEGKWSLTPRLPVNGSNQFDTGEIFPVKFFNADNIIADTFERTNRDVSETVPFAAVMSYRDEPGTAPSEVKSTEVRYAGEALGGPYERYDMSEFCTRQDHAELIGKYIIAMRRWSTHTVRFSTTEEELNLQIGDIFRLNLNVESSAGGTDSYNEVYQVISIEKSQTGLAVVEGQHFPLTPDGKSRITDQLFTNFVRPTQPLIKSFTVTPDIPSPTTGQTVTISPTLDTDLTNLFYQWTTPTGSTAGQGVTTEDLVFVYDEATDQGQYTLTVSSPDALDSPQSASVALGDAIGNVQVTPALRDFTSLNVITLTATFDGNVDDVIWSWAGPATTTAPVSTETSNVLTWTSAGAVDAGTYTVTATSATGFDSPQLAQGTIVFRPFYQMSGGVITTDGDYKIHTFESSGQLSISYAPEGETFEYLLVGSGGPGAYHGGGGGGGVLEGETSQDIGNYQIAVGSSITAPNQGGGDTSGFGLTAFRGGDGFDSDQVWQGYNGPDGACSGGSVNLQTTLKTSTQGFQGGQGQSGGSAYNDNIGTRSTETYASGGGGGGMSSAGTNGVSNDSNNTGSGGNGGEGVTSSISGVPVVYGSGGGGGAYMAGSVSGGTGGTGAGDGGYKGINGVSVNPNINATGYGCGGGGSAQFLLYGAGGPGIAMIRYQFQGEPDPIIGDVTIETSITEFQGGETLVLTANYNGNVADVTYSWSGPAGTNAPVATETSNVLSWTAGLGEDTGLYTCTITSPTAEDSPASGSVQMTYNTFFNASGGVVTYDGNFKIHTFVVGGNFQVSNSPAGTSFEYLIVGNGGNGGTQQYGAGGGGGEVKTGTLSKPVGTYPISVSASNANLNSAFGISVQHGGTAGLDGACGGGQALFSYSNRGLGTVGGDGGFAASYSTGDAAAGGGGGMTQNGGNGTGSTSAESNRTGGNGGNGTLSSITGTSLRYGSGGGGGAVSTYPYTAAGGTSDGGGQGGARYGTSAPGQAAQYAEISCVPPTVYGGGGGGGWQSTSTAQNSGKQGVVIIRYQYQ